MLKDLFGLDLLFNGLLLEKLADKIILETSGAKKVKKDSAELIKSSLEASNIT